METYYRIRLMMLDLQRRWIDPSTGRAALKAPRVSREQVSKWAVNSPQAKLFLNIASVRAIDIRWSINSQTASAAAFARPRALRWRMRLEWSDNN